METRVGREERKARKPWITQEMIKKMEERRKWKNVNVTEYRRLNNALRRETEKAKVQYLEEVCEEIMELQRRGRYDLMYSKARELGGKESKGIRSFGIEDSQGQFVTEEENILKVWGGYIEELYDTGNRPTDLEIEIEDEVEEDDKGPPILKAEVEKAIKDMKRRKATGDDDVPIDLLKELGEEGMNSMTRMINKVYMTGEWPEDFLDVTMIALEKKRQAKKCGDFRTISLISHTAKIVARILNRRLEQKMEQILGEDQFGFRKGKGTRDAIGLMRIISERVLDVNEKLCTCFIDWQKAFDRVNWEQLMGILKNIGVNWRDRRLIKNLYMGQKVKIRINGAETKSTIIGRGVRQGCCLSPTLFNIYAEWLVNEALEGLGDFKVGGRVFKTIKYADDVVLMAKTEEELQRMMDHLVTTGKQYGMEINAEKCKVMKISKEEEGLTILVNNKELDNVSQFRYLGSLLTNDAYCTKEIRERIAMAKTAFNRKRNLLTGKLDIQLRKQLMKCYVWSVALYGSETWTMRKVERKYVESFEMWCWRRMEKIRWTDRITNEEVLRRVNEKRNILNDIMKRKANWLGHIMRRNGLLLDAIEGKIEGARNQGRRRVEILEDIKKKRSYGDLKDAAENRVGWRKEFHSGG